MISSTELQGLVDTLSPTTQEKTPQTPFTAKKTQEIVD